MKLSEITNDIKGRKFCRQCGQGGVYLAGVCKSCFNKNPQPEDVKKREGEKFRDLINQYR